MTKKEIKEEWLKRLRSGKYQQGRENLRKDDAMCCLGVLCEMAVEQGVCKREMAYYDEEGVYGYDRLTATIPLSVQEWSGLRNGTGFYGIEEDSRSKELTKDNDNGKTFVEIADIIEANIQALYQHPEEVV